MDEKGNINRMNERSHIHKARGRTSRKWWAITMLTLTFAMIAAGVLVTAPHFQAAHASGATLTVVPKSASYSAQTGIVVKGQHYAAGEPVKIYWNYTGPGTGTLVATATANATKGAFTTSFPVPLNPTGTYTIAGVGQTSGFIATDTFQLLPQLYGIPEAGGANSAFQRLWQCLRRWRNGKYLLQLYWTQAPGHYWGQPVEIPTARLSSR